MEKNAFEQLAAYKIDEIYNEIDVDVRNKSVIDQLRKWLLQQYPQVPETFYGETLLINFIAYSKSLSVAREKLIGHYRSKIDFPDVLLPCDPADESAKWRISSSAVELFPRLTPNGSRPMYIKFCPRSEDFDLRDLIRSASMKMSLYLREKLPYKGTTLILDLKDINVRHLAEITPTSIKFISAYIRNFPANIELVIYVNVPDIAINVIKIVSSFLRTEVNCKVHIYTGGYENILKHLPEYTLPIELGGTQFSIKDLEEQSYWKLMKHRELFLNEIVVLNKYIIQQNITQKNNAVAPNGIVGSFRKLSIE